MNETRQKQVTSREQEIVFTNFTTEDFDGKWNKKIYRLKANKSYYLPLFLAETFGNHLVQRELNRMAAEEVKKIRETDPRIDQKEVERREMAILSNTLLRQQLMDKCVTITEPTNVDYVSPREVPVREVVLKTNERSAELVRSGTVSPKDLGAFNQPKEPVEEEKFEGLDDKLE